MGIRTYGFQPRGNVIEEMANAYSRSGAYAALSDMNKGLPAFSAGLDALFARGASEAEIASYRQMHDGADD